MKLPEVDILDVASGRYMAFRTDVGIAEMLRTKGAFEPLLAKIAAMVHRKRGGGMLIDIGANMGTFCIPVARETDCEVHAFDAQRIVSQLLAGNFALNGIASGHVHHVALGAPGHPERLRIALPNYASEGNFGAFSTQEDIYRTVSATRMGDSGETEEVQMRTLDSYALEDAFLVKIDVEGAELQVLQGALQTLRESNYPPLIFEAWRDDWWSDQREELLSYVRDLGYEVTQMDENYFAQHEDTPAEERVVVRMEK
jgi:FkbM family methyltransferase